MTNTSSPVRPAPPSPHPTATRGWRLGSEAVDSVEGGGLIGFRQGWVVKHGVDEILNFADEKEISDGSKKVSDKDELYQTAVEIIKSEGKASTSFLQRKLQIGYNRAARIIDMMEEEGVISKANHVGKRDVL